MLHRCPLPYGPGGHNAAKRRKILAAKPTRDPTEPVSGMRLVGRSRGQRQARQAKNERRRLANGRPIDIDRRSMANGQISVKGHNVFWGFDD